MDGLNLNCQLQKILKPGPHIYMFWCVNWNRSSRCLKSHTVFDRAVASSRLSKVKYSATAKPQTPLSNSDAVQRRRPTVTHLSRDFRARLAFLDTKRIFDYLLRNRFRNVVRHLEQRTQPVSGRTHFLTGRSFDKMPRRIMLQLCLGWQLRQSTGPITKLRGRIYAWKPCKYRAQGKKNITNIK